MADKGTVIEGDISTLPDFEGNLRSVANQAAIEIDNLIIGLPVTFSAVPRLESMLSTSVTKVTNPSSPNSTLDAATAIAVNFALFDSRQLKLTQLNDLIVHASTVTDLLEKLVSQPEEFKAQHLDELKGIRAFCLALSKRASVLGRSAERKPQHPFRR